MYLINTDYHNFVEYHLTEPELQADQWKIYPCETTPWTIIKKWAEELTSTSEQEQWEDGRLGKDLKYAEVVNDPHIGKKTVPTSIGLSPEMIEGLTYQTYLKMTLLKHLKKNAA